MPVIIPDPPPLVARFNAMVREQDRLMKNDASFLLKKAIELSPVDSGDFSSAWRIERIDPLALVLTNDVPYAGFVKQKRARLTVEQKLTKIILSRTGVLARRMAHRGAKHLTGGA